MVIQGALFMSENNVLKKVVSKIVKEYIKDNPPEGELKYASIVSGSNGKYSIRILDEYKQPDINYPVIPSVKDSSTYYPGDTVVVGILYGQTYCILKKVI